MTPKQKIELRRSEIRERLAAVAALTGDKLTEEVKTERGALLVELRESEPQLQAAIAAEPEKREVITPTEDAKAKEFRELRESIKLSSYVEAAMESRAVDGKEAEFNAEIGLRAGGAFPLELLAPVEKRTTTNTDSQTTQRTWLDRLFAETAAMHLGVTFESVEPGIASFPVTTAGASAAQRGRAEAAGDAAWTVGVTELKPSRNTVRAVFSDEDAMRLPSLEAALRRDLSMALMEGVDRVIFVGDDGASEAAGDIAGLTTLANVVERTITQANKVKGPETLAEFLALVDGIHATGVDGLRVVATVGANTLWGSTVANAAAENQTVAQFLRASMLTWTTRGGIEAATAADDFGAFVGRGRGIEGAAVSAMWNSGTLIRDIYTGAAKGECALTLSYFWNFGLPRPTSFARVKFVA